VTRANQAVLLQFRAGSLPIYKLSSFIGANGSFRAVPGDLVFREQPSDLVGKDGKPITSWYVSNEHWSIQR
jgi:hypothetical protein